MPPMKLLETVIRGLVRALARTGPLATPLVRDAVVRAGLTEAAAPGALAWLEARGLLVVTPRQTWLAPRGRALADSLQRRTAYAWQRAPYPLATN